MPTPGWTNPPIVLIPGGIPGIVPGIPPGITPGIVAIPETDPIPITGGAMSIGVPRPGMTNYGAPTSSGLFICCSACLTSLFSLSSLILWTVSTLKFKSFTNWIM